MSVLCLAERAHGAVLVITAAEEMTGDPRDRYRDRRYLLYMPASYPSVLCVYHPILESPAPPSDVPPSWHIRYVP